MRSALLKILIIVPLVCSQFCRLSAQINTGINGTVINLPCTQTCISQPFKIPHLKTTSDYVVNSINYTPYPYTSAAPAFVFPCNNQDDKYFDVTSLPFSFCYYDSVVNKLVISTNGSITFDMDNALRGANYAINTAMALPFRGNGSQGTGTCPETDNQPLLPRAGIFGAFCDLLPDVADANYKIEARAEGTAPWRRFVISFSQVKLFNCVTVRMSSQIVLYESTGIVEIFIGNKPACSSNGGLAIVGMQNFEPGNPRGKGITAPGRGADDGPWTAANEAWRFIPSGPLSRFLSCQLLDMTGNTIATGDTITTTAGLLDVTFTNFCQTLPNAQYVIQTTYSACDNVNNQLVVRDTITVNRTTSLNATIASTPTACGINGTGTATVTVPAGIGTAPYTYVLTPGNISQTTNQFNGLTAGTYNIAVTDASGGCSSNLTTNIASTGVLNVTYNISNTSCAGAANGTITVNPPNGTPPIEYSINGGLYTTNNVFTGLPAGNHFISTRDAAGCSRIFDVVSVAQGPALTITTASTPTSCPGATNGTITVTGVNGNATAPYQYFINGGPPQVSPTFTGLTGSPSPYLISVKDAVGCTVSNVPVAVGTGTGTVTGTAAATATACAGVNNGSITITPTSGVGPYQYAINTAGNWQNAATFNGLAPGTYALYIREAGQCISAPISATVTAGNAIQATITTTATSCTGVNNGGIHVVPSNGTAPFAFILDGSVTQNGATADFTAVTSGPHNITITDVNGCTTAAALPATVPTGSGFTASYTSASSSCTGAANGSITVTPAGGTGPYTFKLGTQTQTGATNTTFSNLASGTYNISITDAAGCQYTLTGATITAGAGFTAAFTSVNSTCPGAANGSITVTPNGGAGPYTFKLGTQTLTGTGNATFTNLTSGTYSILITDVIGCQYTLANATVNANTGFSAAYTSIATSCAGAANGSITVTPGTGGTAPYTFVLGASTQTGPAGTFANLAAGAYSIQVTDANSCQFTVSNANVSPGPALNVPVATINTTCPGVNNGSITATPSNGNAPYTFVLDGTINQPGAANTTFAGVAAGNHTLLVTDVNGCSASVPSINIGSGAGITATINALGTSCTGATNGSITVSPTNGTGPFNFVLNGTVSQTGAAATFTNLAAGTTYSVVVTDAIGCSGIFNNINVPQGAALQVNAVPGSTSCNTAANGEIFVQPTNGGGPYTFALTGAVTQTKTGNANTTFTGLPASTYNIKITDAAGCVTGPLPATVTPGPAISVSPSGIDATCFGAATGAINAVASANATTPLEFSLNGTNWQTAAGFNGLAANTYTVYARDAVGCTSSATVVVGQPAVLAATPAVQDVTCNGLTDGKLTINAAGGTAAYSYSIDNVYFQAGNLFSVQAGTYTAYVRDANNCTATATNIIVAEPAALSATAITGSATCEGGNNGSIVVSPAGGVAPYQYAVTGSGSSFQPGPTLNTAPGTFTVTVQDANGCTYQTPPVVVGLTNNLTLAPFVDPAPICEGTGVQLQATTNATQFTWSPATGLDNPAIANPVALPGTTTSYHLVATLGNCSTAADVLVRVLPAPVADGGADPNICFGQSAQLQANGDPSSTYRWAPATYLDNTNGATVNVLLPQRTIAYKLTVTDANGCESLTPDEVTVHVTPPIRIDLHPADTIVYAGPGVQVPLLATSVATDYQWTPAAGLSNPNIPNPVATAPASEGSVAIYHVLAYTAAGCRGEADVIIKVYKGPDIYVANAFTPNNDGKNDYFMPFPVGIKQMNYFRVFNRWGQVVYSSTALNKGWDGRQGGIEQSSGVYTWMAEGITTDNKKISKTGTVMLIR